MSQLAEEGFQTRDLETLWVQVRPPNMACNNPNMAYTHLNMACNHPNMDLETLWVQCAARRHRTARHALRMGPPRAARHALLVGVHRTPCSSRHLAAGERHRGQDT
eukprot:877765-Prymnesium_polylepis.1